MNEESDTWDSSLSRLLDEDIDRRRADVRTYLIGEIKAAYLRSNALDPVDPGKLAEMAVDVIIEFSHQIEKSDTP